MNCSTGCIYDDDEGITYYKCYICDDVYCDYCVCDSDKRYLQKIKDDTGYHYYCFGCISRAVKNYYVVKNILL